jgi:PTS system nitrogen regulatory IIA component
MALGCSRTGIPFKALDGAGVNHVFLVLAPEGLAEDYLHVMERIARLVQNADFRRFLVRATDADEALALIAEMDG